MPVVTVQIAADANFTVKFRDPDFWRQYKAFAIREVTEGALKTIKSYSSKLWQNPTGALDQSWFTRYEQDAGLGFVFNTKPYGMYLNYGVRPHRMSYLLHAKDAFYLVPQPGKWLRKRQAEVSPEDIARGAQKYAVIPIRTGGAKGGVIFRMATSEHMDRASRVAPWWHRGIKPMGFLEAGMNAYVQDELRGTFEGLLVRVLGAQGVPGAGTGI